MEGQAKKSLETILRDANKPVLVDFWAPWCGPCIQIAPLIDEVANDFSGRIELTKVNVEEHPEVAAKYNVMGLPTLMMFSAGEPVNALAGGVSKAAITNLVHSAVGK